MSQSVEVPDNLHVFSHCRLTTTLDGYCFAFLIVRGLVIRPRALCILGKHCTAELDPVPKVMVLEPHAKL